MSQIDKKQKELIATLLCEFAVWSNNTETIAGTKRVLLEIGFNRKEIIYILDSEPRSKWDEVDTMPKEDFEQYLYDYEGQFYE